MSYHDQLQDTDAYDGWGDDDNDPRDYAREGQRVSLRTRRFPAGVAAEIGYRVPGTNCYCLLTDTGTVTYALHSELIF